MQFKEPHTFATLIRRYKRFLADVRLENCETMTVHCPNSGSMKGCSTPGSKVVISRSENPKRKYPCTLEMVKTEDSWVGVNTSRTNHLVQEAIENNIIDDFGTIESIQREVRVSERSRLDFLLLTDKNTVYIEVKNCSLAAGRVAMFPDAVTARGTRHLHELANLTEKGFNTGLIFCVQREDTDIFTPALEIDPIYAQTLEEVQAKGVQIVAYKAKVRPGLITITQKIPVRLSA